jgi:hypothetical protein
MCNNADPFGLFDDHYYNEVGAETATVKNDQPDRYFLLTGPDTFRLDYGLKAGGSKYDIHKDARQFDAEAKHLAIVTAPDYTDIVSMFFQSMTGGTLDFKRLLPDRSLWNAGNGLMAHKHAIGNAAWGKYMSLHGIPLSTALNGAKAQGATTAGGEDPFDQAMIRRGYKIP